MDIKDSVIEIWSRIQEETKRRVEAEPILASFFHSTVLEHSSFSAAIADLIANDLGSTSVQPMMLRSVIKMPLILAIKSFRGLLLICWLQKKGILLVNTYLNHYSSLRALNLCNLIELQAGFGIMIGIPWHTIFKAELQKSTA